MSVYTGKKLRFTQGTDEYILDAANILDFEDSEHFPATGVSGKVYIALDTKVMYIWDTTENDYVPVSSSGGGDGAGFSKITFNFATTDWEAVTGGYEVSVTDLNISSQSEEVVTYDESIENLTSNIKCVKDASNHQITFFTATVPSGAISGRILLFGGASSGTAVTLFEDFVFTIETTDWTGNEAPYTATVTNQRILEGSGIWLFWNKSYYDYAGAYISATVVTGGVVFTTNIKPTGDVSGWFRTVGGVNGTIPPERGGTGVTSVAEI